jgi:predicted ATPase
MGTRLSRVTIRGYKTIKSLEDFELRPLNVLIGANGAGKSNFISFFRMLSWALNGDGGGLQEYIATQGGASRLLHDGPNVTRDIMGS